MKFNELKIIFMKIYKKNIKTRQGFDEENIKNTN